MSEPLTVPGLVRARASADADLEMMVCDDDRVTYRELEERSRAVAKLLVAGAATKSSRIALVMENCVDWVVIATAIMRVGAVIVPLSTLLKPRELIAQLH